jgi:hypothetical protein
MRDTSPDPPEAATAGPGLGAADAAARLLRDGPNALPQERRRGTARIVRDAVREPMLQLLLGAGVIYLLIGDLAEAVILLAFAGVNVGMVVVQEGRTERALAALRQLTSPTALVIRDGARQRVPAAALVADGASWTPAAPDLPERFHPLVGLAMLASRPDPFDPMQRAVFDLGARGAAARCGVPGRAGAAGAGGGRGGARSGRLAPTGGPAAPAGSRGTPPRASSCAAPRGRRRTRPPLGP